MDKEKCWNKARDHPIHDLLGVPRGRRRVQLCCPFPDHDDGTPSFSLFDDNGYKCYGCGKQGHGTVDFLVDMGYSKKDIIDEFG